MSSQFKSRTLGALIFNVIWLFYPICAALTKEATAAAPRFDHVVLVIFENHSFSQIFDDLHARTIINTASDGILFTNAKAVAHPSQPNYFALYSGSTQGVEDDHDHILKSPTLGSQLRHAGKQFIGFVEPNSPRKHNPWESFIANAEFEQPFNSFPTDFAKLPDVAFVIPNLDDDMHDGTIGSGDKWFKSYILGYAAWAKKHRSLLIVTFDEAYGDDQRIFTFFVGANLKSGHSTLPVNHYTVLRTIQDIEGLPGLAESTKETPINGVWSSQ